jgi:hypothetical protein
MDEVGFQHVSLISTITVCVADEHAHVQRLVLVVKMPTVFEEYTEEEQSLLRVLLTEGLNAKNTHKEMFSVYVEK